MTMKIKVVKIDEWTGWDRLGRGKTEWDGWDRVGRGWKGLDRNGHCPMDRVGRGGTGREGVG